MICDLYLAFCRAVGQAFGPGLPLYQYQQSITHSTPFSTRYLICQSIVSGLLSSYQPRTGLRQGARDQTAFQLWYVQPGKSVAPT